MPRLVYSLHLETEREPGEPITEFIVPLDRNGNSTGDLVPSGKRRVVDLRPGDEFVHGRRRSGTSSRPRRRTGNIK